MIKIDQKQLKAFAEYLQSEERSRGTVEKYLRDVKCFAAWQEKEGNYRSLSKEAVAAWKQSLVDREYRPSTINSMIAAINRFFCFLGREDCRIRFLKVQRNTFRKREKEMTREDYKKLVATAYQTGNIRLALLMEAICSTGLRVSEVKYLTVEAAEKGRAQITLKGKIRTVLLPLKLCRKLMRYARKKKIKKGAIFVTASGKDLGRKQIWAEMKKLSKTAGVEPEKIFPHNLRHLFARTFYKVSRDLSKLADLLGHSSIDTTRIYLQTTEKEHIKELERLNLVS